MKATRAFATSVFLGWICQNAVAVPPPLDRPSPPPCCADGQCFASPGTYGVYATRWRQWPIESMAPAPAEKTSPLSAPLQREVSPFVTPLPKEEDRKAPPPSVPVGEQTPAGANGASRTQSGQGGQASPQGTQPPGPAGTQPRTAPAYPPSGFPTPPQTAPAAPPAGQGTQPSTAPLYKSVSPDSPLNRSGPMGDLDPPPSLPFGPVPVAPEQPMRAASQPAAMPMPTRGPIAQPAPRTFKRPAAGRTGFLGKLCGVVSCTGRRVSLPCSLQFHVKKWHARAYRLGHVFLLAPDGCMACVDRAWGIQSDCRQTGMPGPHERPFA